MIDKISFSDLVDKIAHDTGASKSLIHDLLIEMADVTKEGLERDGRVNISGLGHFSLKWHEVRTGRNPRTGEEIEIPAHNTINFKATSDLRKYINREYGHLKPEIIETDEPELPVIPLIPHKQEPEPEHKPLLDNGEKERKSFSWLWLIIPLIIIVLAFLFWPSKKDHAPVVEAPAQFDTQTEDVKPEPEKQQVVAKEPKAVETESIVADKQPASSEEKIGTPGGTRQVQSGDKLWTIANEYYQQAYLWPNIYRVNLNRIDNPDILSIGENLEIPPLQGEPGSLTRQDRDEIAAGFIEVYLDYKRLGKQEAQYYLWVVSKWEVQEVIQRYKNRIDDADLKFTSEIDGSPLIK